MPLFVILIVAAQACSSQGMFANAPDFVGRWGIDLVLADTTRHVLRLDAEPSGKGFLLVQDPRSSLVESAKPSDARWTQVGEKRVTFSGPVEFSIGNVGREQGTLVFNGTFVTEDLISGELAFFRAGDDPSNPQVVPSKSGTFNATRILGAQI